MPFFHPTNSVKALNNEGRIIKKNLKRNANKERESVRRRKSVRQEVRYDVMCLRRYKDDICRLQLQ